MASFPANLAARMGRHSGFIALHAGLAARHADIVMLPEMEISALAKRAAFS